MFKIAVLCSTRGSNITNAPVVETANDLGVPLLIVVRGELSREEYDKILIEQIEKRGIDLIILNGWMRILSKGFIDYFHGKIINIHPSLLPKFAGGMDLNVHQAVIDAGESETGCTLHFATEEPDAGPIIIQRSITVESDDTVDTLKQKVQVEEQKALCLWHLFQFQTKQVWKSLYRLSRNIQYLLFLREEQRKG